MSVLNQLFIVKRELCQHEVLHNQPCRQAGVLRYVKIALIECVGLTDFLKGGANTGIGIPKDKVDKILDLLDDKIELGTKGKKGFG